MAAAEQQLSQPRPKCIRRHKVTLYPPAPSTPVAKCFCRHSSEHATPPKRIPARAQVGQIDDFHAAWARAFIAYACIGAAFPT
jgi:hypothetical protein